MSDFEFDGRRYYRPERRSAFATMFGGAFGLLFALAVFAMLPLLICGGCTAGLIGVGAVAGAGSGKVPSSPTTSKK